MQRKIAKGREIGRYKYPNILCVFLKIEKDLKEDYDKDLQSKSKKYFLKREYRKSQQYAV